MFRDDELAVISQHSVAFGQVIAPIRAHQRLAVNADVDTFIFFLRGKVGDVSDERTASFLGYVIVSLNREFLFIGVMACDVVATASEIQNAKAMLAFIAEMIDDAIARDLRLVYISLETDVTGGMIRVPFGGIGLQLFVGGGRFLRSPRTTGEFIGRIGDDAF